MSSDECCPEKRKQADELLTTLSDPIRREIIHYFEIHSEDPNTSLDELAAHIADRMPAENKERLMLELPQTHFSTLQSDGWLSYDMRTGSIKYHGDENAKQLLTEVRDMF
jgi:hypothetical protein